MTPIWKLFILACPKCGSERLRQRFDHLGCLDCGRWVFRATPEGVVLILV